jgi:hypothetical protein
MGPCKYICTFALYISNYREPLDHANIFAHLLNKLQINKDHGTMKKDLHHYFIYLKQDRKINLHICFIYLKTGEDHGTIEIDLHLCLIFLKQ